MKICRFCNHEQENGNYCDACGSPLSADKVDFSDISSDSLSGFGEFPDPTKSAFPDPTQQAFPDPTVSSSYSSLDDLAGKKSESSQEHVAGAAVAAFGTKDTPEKPMTSPEELMSKGAEPTQPEKKTDAPVTKPQKKESEVSETKAQDKGDNVFGTQFPDPTLKEKKDSKPKIMYSAAEHGETVYAKSKGGLGTDFTPVQPGPGWWNGAPNSGTGSTSNDAQNSNNSSSGQTTAPSASQNTGASQNQETLPVFSVGTQGQSVGTNPEFKQYENLYTHVLVSFGLSLLGLVCCCGMTILATVFSAIAYGKMHTLKKGISMQPADEVIPKVKKYVLISDILLGISFLLMAIAVISNAASSG
ncbi:MAG: hypothetical protein J5636_08470 [Clostridiales bacterium]|nr:hypothetical protein [Clostridiales bacterium]